MKLGQHVVDLCQAKAPFIILYHEKGWLSPYSSCFWT